jgi:hypothetical protein
LWDNKDPLGDIFNDGEGNGSASALIGKLRRRYHQSFSKALAQYSFGIDDVEGFFRERRENDSEVRNSIAMINDRIGFLNCFDEIVEGDRGALFMFLVENSNPDNIRFRVDSFSYAQIKYSNQREQEVVKMLRKVFCDVISTGSYETSSDIP